YWGNSNTDSAGLQIAQAAKDVLSSPYLTGIQQYLSDGIATFAPGLSGPTTDVLNDPSNGNFGDDDIKDLVNNLIDQSFLPDNKNAIYMVVTAPGVRSKLPGVGGDNFVKDDHPTIWVSTDTTDGDNNSPSISVDQFSMKFSHELVECMSSPNGDGYEV